ncbi:MAG: hypothetical protein UV64_C0005G0003 [Parcubacteria group bacterium GW2011_GWC1_43_11b]|uniref:Cell division protein FtsL n=2 Tax=Candidatus Vogeliibacteriota TaxID=1817922 RepID=A0A1G2QEJ0_9BACT|nr:MAG: hypothetical protein UV50_C0018G0004 [Parcubacteria group bacterium GW2011_GWB1_42_9]KKS89484.1 MAG: hypothetical protein UV64_C0005G0003 [Parcubacteria group bacterium GW2011_GWC1_43_11b]KKT10161.1 MAG: hypothetical protein UV88_C0001G0057 [Parcubacteria group bacterium GW2011_GWA1_43_21]OHA59006.1 MAG: hypothetical protein A2370_00600 [Candidatus Vogelbacteria bacterium RIFOXYB1_FULL_42_16]OHA60339.1 MAG: hypothetical protein A2607_01950 [Candidatus Vogelbacteria bacterium RIFOXYD1_FU
MNTKTLNINYHDMNGSNFITAMVVLFLVLGVAYIYLVNTTVFLVNARSDAEDGGSQIESELALLETEYLSAQSAIDLPFVLAHGFIEAPKDSTFAYRPKLQNQEPALSLR